MIPELPKHILIGTVLATGTILAAWYLGSVFGRSWQAIALILLAMLVVILLRRMVIGAVPLEPIPPRDHEQETETRDLWEETAHLSGIDHRYAWIALPPALMFVMVLVTLFA